MPVKLSEEQRKRLKEATRRIDAGEISYDKLKDEFNVGVATAYRYHKERLEEDISRLKKDLDKVSHRYKIEVKRLYKERDQLKEEIATLMEQRNQMTQVFEDRNLTWEQGLSLLKEVSDLRLEKVKVKKELEGYDKLIKQQEKIAGEKKRTIQRLQHRLEELKGEVTAWNKARFEHESWFQFKFPELQQKRERLIAEVNTLKAMKERLAKEFREFIEDRENHPRIPM